MHSVKNHALAAELILQLGNLIFKLAGSDALLDAQRGSRTGGFASDHGLLEEALMRGAGRRDGLAGHEESSQVPEERGSGKECHWSRRPWAPRLSQRR